ncbi:hypothetical protein QUB68_20055 [Microcoleus sp. A006_D1]|uniref:hypothetical protein n=1 Tax=Microcoleus sp. A006_D1 TaxID=3055267 RepID=UPI002FD4D763
MRPIIKRTYRSGIACDRRDRSRPGTASSNASTLTFGAGQKIKQDLKFTHSNLQIKRKLEPQKFGNSCKVNFRSQMCRFFTLKHQEIEAKNNSIEAKVRTELLRATSPKNRCSSWQAIENII